MSIFITLDLDPTILKIAIPAPDRVSIFFQPDLDSDQTGSGSDSDLKDLYPYFLF